MLHILFSILISIGTVSSAAVTDYNNVKKSHDIEIYGDKVLLDIDEDSGEF